MQLLICCRAGDIGITLWGGLPARKLLDMRSHLMQHFSGKNWCQAWTAGLDLECPSMVAHVGSEGFGTVATATCKHNVTVTLRSGFASLMQGPFCSCTL